MPQRIFLQPKALSGRGHLPQLPAPSSPTVLYTARLLRQEGDRAGAGESGVEADCMAYNSLEDPRRVKRRGRGSTGAAYLEKKLVYTGSRREGQSGVWDTTTKALAQNRGPSVDRPIKTRPSEGLIERV